MWFLVGALIGALAGCLIWGRYLRREIAADIGPRLQRIQLQLDNLETALTKGFEELDGFYTFLMGTHDKLALVRDPFACKPAVVAETDDYVAIASEFRSLAKLPDVKNASLFEPMPQELYVWQVQS